MKFTFVCSAFLVSSVSCIMSGRDVDSSDETGFVVAINSNEEPSSNLYCGGVFIKPRYVLTAASCVQNRQIEDIWITAGVTNIRDREQAQFKINKVFAKNPSGQNKVQNNIAILWVYVATSNQANLHKVKYIDDFALTGSEMDVGARCKAFGWGQTGDRNIEVTALNCFRDPKESTNILQVGTGKLEDLKSCKLRNKDVDESNVCTEYWFGRLCNFDAGDPLVTESGHQLIGIATEHYSCFAANFYNVFTKIEPHVEWIRNTIETNEAENKSSALKSKVILSVVAFLIICFIF